VSQIIATLTPADVKPDRYILKCRECERRESSHMLPYVRGIAEAHVQGTGHTVDITDEEAEG